MKKTTILLLLDRMIKIKLGAKTMAFMIAKTKTGIGSKGTEIWNDNGHFMVQLYATVVYDETAETVTLANGGWNTPTTAQRINSALIYRGFRSGISRVGGTMAYNNKPFVNGVLVLKVEDLRREKIEWDIEMKRLMSEVA